MARNLDFTTGKIISPLLRFALPVLLAMFLQALYGAIDLAIVGQFSSAANVSAVGTGSQIMMTITGLITSFAMGLTILLGQRIGEGQMRLGGQIIGAGIWLFALVGLFLTAAIAVFSGGITRIMQAPEEAFALTRSYVLICGCGALAIVGYNFIAAVFRGLGDSTTPMITVLIASIANVAGDLLLVAVLDMGAVGAAIATVGAQLISVVISFFLIRRRGLPFEMSRKMIRPDGQVIRRVIRLGVPIALQDFLVGVSFLIILAIVNTLGVTASAGVGVAERVCTFIMLIPISFMQSMSAFVAQNKGAGKYDRALKSLWMAIGISTLFGIAMFYAAFFHGDLLARLFSNDPAVTGAAAEYLMAYGIDCLLTCFLFCFIGFFNGMGMTTFVMIQGISAAFLIRVPVAWIFSHREPVSLFFIGLGIPISTVFQITLCFIALAYLRKKLRRPAPNG